MQKWTKTRHIITRGLLVVCLLGAAVSAHAQDRCATREGTDDCQRDTRDVRIAPAAALQQATSAVATIAATDGIAGCDEMDDQQKEQWSCGKLGDAIVGIAAYELGGNPVADAAASYCLAAELYYGLKDIWNLFWEREQHIDDLLNQIDAQVKEMEQAHQNFLEAIDVYDLGCDVMYWSAYCPAGGL